MNTKTTSSSSLNIEPTIESIQRERPILGRALTYMQEHYGVQVHENKGILEVVSSGGAIFGRFKMMQYPNMVDPRLFLINGSGNPIEFHLDDEICDFNTSRTLLNAFASWKGAEIEDDYVAEALEGVTLQYSDNNPDLEYTSDQEKPGTDAFYAKQKKDVKDGNFRHGIRTFSDGFHRKLEHVIRFCVESDLILCRIERDDENYLFSVATDDGEEIGYFFWHSAPQMNDQIAFKRSGKRAKRKIHAGSMMASVLQAIQEREGSENQSTASRLVIENVAETVQVLSLVRERSVSFIFDGIVYYIHLKPEDSIPGEVRTEINVVPGQPSASSVSDVVIIFNSDGETFQNTDGAEIQPTEFLANLRDEGIRKLIEHVVKENSRRRFS